MSAAPVMWSCEDRQAPFVEVFRRSAARAGYDVRIIAPAAEPPGFTELKRHYRHMSPNPPGFELASFRRWFEIAAVNAPETRFVLADSDLVVQTPWAELPAELRDFDGLAGSIGATGGVLEAAISGGFSVWTGRLLAEFCEYIVGIYAAGAADLIALHTAKLAAGHPRFSVSDMTLLHGWVQSRRVPFLNINRLFADAQGRQHYVDHNFFMPEALGVRFAMTLGRKRVDFTRDGLRLTTAAGEPVIPASLHLVGRYKIMAAAIERRDRLELAARSAYIVGGRTGRKLLGALGISA